MCAEERQVCRKNVAIYIYIYISKIANLNSVWMSAAAYVVKVPTA